MGMLRLPNDKSLDTIVGGTPQEPSSLRVTLL